MQQPNFVIYVPWCLWFLSWLGAALLTNAAKRLSLAQDALYRTIIIVGSITLLFGFLPDPGFDVRNMLWQPLDGTVGWMLFGLVVAAFLFAWWARIQLGFTLPGSTKKQKAFVETGPYKWVRHPIYLSLILASYATALVFGRPSSLAGATLIAAGLVLKIVLEEGALRSELGTFDDYAERVPMLVPGLKFGAERWAAPPMPPRPPEMKPVIDLFPPGMAPATAGGPLVSPAAPAMEKLAAAVETVAAPPTVEKVLATAVVEKAAVTPAADTSLPEPAPEAAAASAIETQLAAPAAEEQGVVDAQPEASEAMSITKR